jgi:hypothetical protein
MSPADDPSDARKLTHEGRSGPGYGRKAEHQEDGRPVPGRRIAPRRVPPLGKLLEVAIQSEEPRHFEFGSTPKTCYLGTRTIAKADRAERIDAVGEMLKVRS